MVNSGELLSTPNTSRPGSGRALGSGVHGKNSGTSFSVINRENTGFKWTADAFLPKGDFDLNSLLGVRVLRKYFQNFTKFPILC